MMRNLVTKVTGGLAYFGALGTLFCAGRGGEDLLMQRYVARMRERYSEETSFDLDKSISNLEKSLDPRSWYSLAAISLLPTVVGGKLYSMLAEDSRNRR